MPLMNLVEVLVRFISAPPLLGPPKLVKVLKEVQLLMPLLPKISPNGEEKKPNGPRNDVLKVLPGLCLPRDPTKPTKEHNKFYYILSM